MAVKVAVKVAVKAVTATALQAVVALALLATAVTAAPEHCTSAAAVVRGVEAAAPASRTGTLRLQELSSLASTFRMCAADHSRRTRPVQPPCAVVLPWLPLLPRAHIV